MTERSDALREVGVWLDGHVGETGTICLVGGDWDKLITALRNGEMPNLEPPPPPPTSPAQSGDYFCDEVVVNRGQITIGGHSDLHDQNGSYLKIAAEHIATTGVQYAIDWYTKITLPGNQVKELKVSYAGKNTRGCNQRIMIFNFASGKWQSIWDGIVGTSIVNVEAKDIPNILDCVSALDEIWIRVYASSALNFTNWCDLLKISVVY